MDIANPSLLHRAIPFARDGEGNWRSVDEVPRGLSCGCWCPSCQGPVVARKGQVRVHHFAHHDRRECRHALEASLFGMTVTLLQTPGAVLQLPPAVQKTEWLPQPDGILTPQQRTKFFADPWVVPARRITLRGVHVRAGSIEQSVAGRPEVDSAELIVHLLSHKKGPEHVPGSETIPVLALDLRAYAKQWWQVCDADQDPRVAAASQAKERLREWLARSERGRVWISHPEVGEKRKKFDAWWARQVQARREQLERQNEAKRERTAGRSADAGRRLIPLPEYTVSHFTELREPAPGFVAWATPAASESAPVDAPVEREDEVIAQLESVCPICLAPQREVRFGSGLFAGKRAVQCSLHPRHPVKMLQ